ncbi:MAG: DUF499 domain-containing protein [Gammaproteobacteria bacterium]|nr:DUF499 domain-containing protein [Gammaproteobacteria bacterium]
MSARSAAQPAKQRVDQGLEALRLALAPYVAKHMRDRHGEDWQRYASRARPRGSAGELDLYGLLKTLLDNWNDLFRHDREVRKRRSFISICLDARNAAAHFAGRMEDREALRYLDAMRELCLAVGAGVQTKRIEGLYELQQTASAQLPSASLALDVEPPPPARLAPWRDVCEPHPDVLEARFSDAEFAANLAQVDQGEGGEEYANPAAFFRITYATEGLRRVLTSAIARLAVKGGDPVIGLQTNFGGGKTHTMLALHHVAGASEAGYKPEELAGLAPIFDAAGVTTLGRVRRAVFVGTHKGAAEVMYVEGDREIRTLWGYIAWRLGGWEAFDHIAASEVARTNPGSERLIPILRAAAPCLILMDEVVAFARQLRGLEYDAFHAFVQSLTEAAAAVRGAVVVGSLPESGAEVGDEQGRDALRRLEKIFGRVQSAWMPASGIETFEIVRRRLFQPLDEAGEKARDATIRAFRKLYRDNRADFPPYVREPAYAEEMRSAWPIHPEVLRRFSGDWSVLDKFQRTRGILKIMASVVYALWSGESNAPLILPALLPFRDPKSRSALLEPLNPVFGAILDSEVDGEQSLTARIEAQRPRLLKAHAATLAARSVFFATAPHNGAVRGGMMGAELRLSCAQPGDQIAIYGEALQEIASRSAHLYQDENRYWFSPQPTLNKVAADRARDINDEQADQRIIEFLREERRFRAGFARVHAAPDHPADIDDQRSTALVILPPSKPHESGAGSNSEAGLAAAETIERRGSGQRRYRNALVFLGPDAANLASARENARRERAWASILKDSDLQQNLTRAQLDNAQKQASRSLDALRQSVRAAWVHVLYPSSPDEGDTESRPDVGYVIRSTRLVNRGGGKGIPQAVWDKVSTDGGVIAEMGPANLAQSLEPVWPADAKHITIEQIRDWFASYVYLPRLRDEVALDGAVRRLVADLASPYAFATSFDESANTYEGVVEGEIGPLTELGTGLLVRREALQKEATLGEQEATKKEQQPAAGEKAGVRDKEPSAAKPQPKRFYASLPIDSDLAGLEVARIMDGLLVELTRTDGSDLKLTLEIEGTSTSEGYPKDVVDTVKANARDLKLDTESFGFEED